MKKYILLLGVLCCGFAQAGEKQYSGHGITFTYSDDLSASGKVSGVPTITVKNSTGIQVMIQDYGKVITSEKLSVMMVDQLKKIFKKRATELANKTVNRPIFGKKREGRYLMIVQEGVPIECVVFAFEHSGRTWCVMTQQACKDTAEAEKYFATIQASLKVKAEPNKQ